MEELREKSRAEGFCQQEDDYRRDGNEAVRLPEAELPVMQEAEGASETGEAAAAAPGPGMGVRLKQHYFRFLDHPVAGYFLLTLHGYLLLQVISAIFSFRFFLPYSIMETFRQYGLYRAIPFIGSLEETDVYQSVAGFSLTAGALIALVLHKQYFYPDFRGCLKKQGVFKAFLLMLLPLLPVLGLNLLSLLYSGIGNPVTAVLLALAAGSSEEVAFRGLGISNFMRTQRSGEKIPLVFWVSALTFGLFHLTNLLAGAAPFSTLVQVLYCICIGAFFSGVYLRTGSLWPCIAAHFLIDLIALLNAGLNETGGVMTEEAGADSLILVVAALPLLIAGLVLIRKKRRAEILAVWDERWSREDQQPACSQGENSL